MQYQVPQFIEVEDKIFGPLTFKQFIYLAGGGGLCLVFFTLLPIYLTFLLSIPVVSLSAALAFYKVNGRPFVNVLEHAFKYFTGSKLYLWKQREAHSTQAKEEPEARKQPLPVPALSENRLKDLAWSLNIKDRVKTEAVDTQRAHFEL